VAAGASLSRWLAASREARASALASCLDRIRELDPRIQAWVQVAPRTGGGSGALAGIPYGAKDIIETRGLATEYGSAIYRGRIGSDDAAVISDLTARGAVLLGKTHTTAFAYRTPALTRNPRNLQHTPGGSSSGSAAAVAAGMVPFALGTQTQGSVLRPASFCGICGFKPTYGTLPMDGVLPLAPTLDTLGLFTETAADMLALWDALGRDTGASDASRVGVPSAAPGVEPSMAAAFARAIERVHAGGFDVVAVDLAAMLAVLNDASRVVMAYEAARVHDERYRQHGERLQHMAELVRVGRSVSAADYQRAVDDIARYRVRMSEQYADTPVILVPSAMGPAPAGLASTGDPRMNAPWTALGTPAISIPMGFDNGLPLGLQLTADRGDDALLLRTAITLEVILADV
jgi:amidase